jgi:5S rRNA maturation endonuclease (ribonuclease M5)
LSARLKEKQEKLQQLLTQLAEESAKGTLILVEGKKDVEALRALNVGGPVLAVKTGGKSFIEAVHEIEKMGALAVILLLDFDRRGKLGTSRLKVSMEHAKIVPNLKFWRGIYALAGRDLQCIEGLPTYMRTLEQKTSCL